MPVGARVVGAVMPIMPIEAVTAVGVILTIGAERAPDDDSNYSYNRYNRWGNGFTVYVMTIVYSPSQNNSHNVFVLYTP